MCRDLTDFGSCIHSRSPPPSRNSVVDLVCQHKDGEICNEIIYADGQARKAVEVAAKTAYCDVFQSDVKTRYIVAGFNQALNGRSGSIRHWDASKAKFFVGLDSRKGHTKQKMFLKLLNMDFNAPEPQEAKQKYVSEKVVKINLDNGLRMTCMLTKGTVEQIRNTKDPDQCLIDLIERSDEIDRQRQRVEQSADPTQQALAAGVILESAVSTTGNTGLNHVRVSITDVSMLVVR